jgi:hypothetical protein
VPLSRHEPDTGPQVLREVIRSLKAWDTVECSFVMLEPGAILSGCRIHPGRGPETEPYVMEFHSCGRHYACPLYSFQPRTQAVELVWVEELAAPA